MKTCPFCAEDIQDAAIKCKHCGSMISAAPPAYARAQSEPVVPPRAQSEPAPPRAQSEPAPPRAQSEPAPPPREREPERGPAQDPFVRGRRPLQSEVGETDERRVLYSGYPSWRAFFAQYAAVVLLGIIVPLLTQAVFRAFDASTFTVVLAILIPIAIAAGAFFIIGVYRRSKVVRISTTNIETEYGILSKKIDVLELWRCRDVRYKQSLFDRILGIAHIEIYTADVTTPQLEVVGLPASRRLFEKIRDSIEIQRHSRNVVGFVQ